MSIHAKRAAFVITVFLTFAVYRVMSGVTVGRTRSRPEAILDFLLLSAVVCLFFYWRHRRASKVQPQSPAPRP
jgi:hypothetical protein